MKKQAIYKIFEDVEDTIWFFGNDDKIELIFLDDDEAFMSGYLLNHEDFERIKEYFIENGKMYDVYQWHYLEYLDEYDYKFIITKDESKINAIRLLDSLIDSLVDVEDYQTLAFIENLARDRKNYVKYKDDLED